jgi:uncharacterized protein YciI
MDIELALVDQKPRRFGFGVEFSSLEGAALSGTLLIPRGAGPHPAVDSEDPGEEGFSGSLVVAEFDSLEDARSWADADPYVKAGVYRQFVVKPFKKVLP